MKAGKGKIFFSRLPVWEDPDEVLRSGRTGLLCNQNSWHPETGEYLFESFYKRGVLKRVFTPEHGLFGELQDQVKTDQFETDQFETDQFKIDGKKPYAELGISGCEFVSLYGSGEESLYASPEKLKDLDALIVDLQDAGVRYYTYLSTLRNLFITLKKGNMALPVWIADRENPAGPWAEGAPLAKEYASFIGIEGIPHRHGLTIGELACYFHAEMKADFPLHIVSKDAVPGNFPWLIPPSPNFPGYFTAGFYSGQCLWEGTNVSEGRGTTRPFEVFGAPWMESLVTYNREAGYENWNDPNHPLFDPVTALRWHRFIPVFHKYSGECCFGFQLIRRNLNEAYHALFHALRMIRFLAAHCEGFAFRPAKYEAGNERTAIELLAGDVMILDYLKGAGPQEKDLLQYFRKHEKKWIADTKKYRLYEEPLKSAAISREQ